VAGVLATAFRDGLRAVRGSGWRAPLLAVLSYLPLVALGPLLGGGLLPVGLVLHVVVLVALVRALGAARPEPLAAPPEVDEQGRRVQPPPRPGPPLTAADRAPFVALRNAFRLLRASVSITGLYLLAGVTAGLTVVALSGGGYAGYSDTVRTLTVLPLSAAFTAFVVLATQRVGLEGDPRVLVAAAHSVRIARTAYPALLLVAIAEPAVAVGGTLLVPGEHPPAGRVVAVGLATLVVATVVKVVVTAFANELYAAGPRLDLPLDPG
jgi:hypothetical protein